MFSSVQIAVSRVSRWKRFPFPQFTSRLLGRSLARAKLKLLHLEDAYSGRPTLGTADEALRVEKTRAQIQMLREGGFKIDYREYTKGHHINEDCELPEIREWMMARVGE